MGRLLNEDMIIKVLERWQKAFKENSHYVSASDLSLVVKDVKELPPAQPEPHEGHWIQYDKRFPWRHHYKCSVCGNYLDFTGVNGGRGNANYCPNCGARMKGEI